MGGSPGGDLGRPRSRFFREVDCKIDLETIINGRSMPWSFGCAKRRPERMELKQFYGFARFTRRGITKKTQILLLLLLCFCLCFCTCFGWLAGWLVGWLAGW